MSTFEPSPCERKSPCHCATNRLSPLATFQLEVNEPLALTVTVWDRHTDEPGRRYPTVTRSLPEAGLSLPVTTMCAALVSLVLGVVIVRSLELPVSPPVVLYSSDCSPPSR